MITIDLNNLPGSSAGRGKSSVLGDPHWLSGSGKVDRKGIHERVKAAYLAKRGPRISRHAAIFDLVVKCFDS